MSVDELKSIALGVYTYTFNALIDKGMSEKIAYEIADAVEAEFISAAGYLTLKKIKNTLKKIKKHES